MIFFMIYVILILCVVFFLSAGLAQPSIAFDGETWDFGSVASSVTVEHTFEVKNTGDEDLIIDKLIPS